MIAALPSWRMLNPLVMPHDDLRRECASERIAS